MTGFSINTFKTIIICVIASFLIAGFLNPIGQISSPVAEAFGIPVTVAVARFGYYTVGVFAGYILSFYLFDAIKIKTALIVGYSSVAVAVAALYLLESSLVFTVSLFIIGVLISVQVCGASTLVSWIWSGKQRQTMLIAQDAMFNGGGIVFTAMTTWFLANKFHWASTYVVVAGVALVIVIIAATTNIREKHDSISGAGIETSWNTGIVAVGGSVLLFMVAKISIFIWVPQYAMQTFDASIEQSGRLMTNIFTGAFTASLLGTYVVSKVRIEYFLIAMLSIGATGVWLMLSATDINSVLITGYIVGASVGATFNGYMAFGLSFVRTPTHKNVAYVLLAGGVGAAIAPWFSSTVVESTGAVGDALRACLGIQGVVLISVVLLTIFGRKWQVSTEAVQS